MRPYAIDIATSTTAAETTFPEGIKLVSVTNLDAVIAITISFEATVGTAGNPETVLAATEAVSFANEANAIKCKSIHHDAASGTPSLRVIGYVE